MRINLSRFINFAMPLVRKVRILVGLFTLLFTFFIFNPSSGQDPMVPEDFEVVLTSGPALQDSPLDIESITINADGTAILSARQGNGEPIPQTTIELSEDSLEGIYQAVQDRRFFELDEVYSDPAILDGDYAILRITANGTTHEVRTENIRVFDFDLVAMAVNARVPFERGVIYNALREADYKEVER